MKKSILIILALALACTCLCACGMTDRDSGNVSDNDNGVITDENNGDDIIDRTEDVKPGATPDMGHTDKPVATAIPGDNANSQNGGNAKSGTNSTRPITP